jgi:hypothetical protein
LSPALCFCYHEENSDCFPKLVVAVVELQCFTLNVKCYLVEFEAFVGALSGAIGVAHHGVTRYCGLKVTEYSLLCYSVRD